MFADDTTLIISGKTTEEIQDRINTTTNQTELALKNLKLEINHSKSALINFTPINRSTVENLTTNLNYEIVDSATFLGITIDKNLSWKNQINNLLGKLSTAAFGIKRIQDISGNEAALTANHSLFASYIRFGVIAWGAAPNAYLEQILVLQKKIIRKINNIAFDAHCKPYILQGRSDSHRGLALHI